MQFKIAQIQFRLIFLRLFFNILQQIQTSNSDTCGCQELQRNVNFAEVDGPNQAALLKGLKAANITVSNTPKQSTGKNPTVKATFVFEFDFRVKPNICPPGNASSQQTTASFPFSNCNLQNVARRSLQGLKLYKPELEEDLDYEDSADNNEITTRQKGCAVEVAFATVFLWMALIVAIVLSGGLIFSNFRVCRQRDEAREETNLIEKSFQGLLSRQPSQVRQEVLEEHERSKTALRLKLKRGNDKKQQQPEEAKKLTTTQLQVPELKKVERKTLNGDNRSQRTSQKSSTGVRSTSAKVTTSQRAITEQQQEQQQEPQQQTSTSRLVSTDSVTIVVTEN